MKKAKFLIAVLTLTIAAMIVLASCGKAEPGCIHEYTGKTTTDATCINDGVKTFTCSKCGDSYTEVVPATGKHNYKSEITTAATCTKDGVKTYTCSGCGDSYTETISATGKHSYTSKVTVAATCTKSGVKTYTCSGCGESYTETVAATGKHNYRSKVISVASCKEDGIVEYTCSICGNSYRETTPAGHEWKNASCTEPKTCMDCGATEGSALGHTTNDGICARCNKNIFTPLEFSGTGDKVIQGVNLRKGVYKATLTHNEDRYFSAVLYSGEGKWLKLMANESNAYSGSCLLNYSVDGGYIEVEAKGYWTIKIEKVPEGGTSNIKGTGDCVSPLFNLPKGAQVVKINHTGKGHFSVVVYDDDGKWIKLLANTSGDYSGEVIFNGGDPNKKFCIWVEASGDWSVDFGITNNVTTCAKPPIPGAGTGGASGGGTTTGGGTSGGGTTPGATSSDKWSVSDARNLNSYSNKASEYVLKASDYAIKSAKASSPLDVAYLKQSVSANAYTKRELMNMKSLADSKVSIDLTGGKYATLQEKIDNAIELCDEIAAIEITSEGYIDQSLKINLLFIRLSTECVELQKLTVDLMKAFT